MLKTGDGGDSCLKTYASPRARGLESRRSLRPRHLTAPDLIKTLISHATGSTKYRMKKGGTASLINTESKKRWTKLFLIPAYCVFPVKSDQSC